MIDAIKKLPTWVKVVVGVLIIGLIIGLTSSKDDDKSTSASAPASDSAPATDKPKSYRAQVVDCLENDASKVTHDAGNAIRVESHGGRLIANVQTFPTVKKAKAFNSQLAVPSATGGKGVAVWLSGANGTDKPVVTDCLTP